MRRESLVVAAILGMTVLSGPVLAQTAAPGPTENNLNNPGSVKSDAEKGMPSTSGIVAPAAPVGTATGSAPGSTESNLNNPGSVKSDAEKAGR